MVMMRETGIAELDSLTHGGVPDDGVTLIAGKHGSGKTLLLVSAALWDPNDSLIISTTGDYSRISDMVRALCTEHGWERSDVDIDISTGMWIVITTPISTIRFAGPMTKASSSLKRIMDTIGTMVDSRTVNSVYVDNPLHGTKNHDDVDTFMEFIHDTARRSSTRFMMTMRTQGNPAEYKLSDIPKQVRRNTDLILYTPTWPKVDGTDMVVETWALYNYVDKVRTTEQGGDARDTDEPRTTKIRFDRTGEKRVLGKPRPKKARKTNRTTPATTTKKQ